MLKFSIYLPNESLEDAESLQELVSDLGDSLVNHGFFNELTVEEGALAKDLIDKLNSFIIIDEEPFNPLENLTDAFLVIPIKDENNG